MYVRIKLDTFLKRYYKVSPKGFLSNYHRNGFKNYYVTLIKELKLPAEELISKTEIIIDEKLYDSKKMDELIIYIHLKKGKQTTHHIYRFLGFKNIYSNPEKIAGLHILTKSESFSINDSRNATFNPDILLKKIKFIITDNIIRDGFVKKYVCEFLVRF